MGLTLFTYRWIDLRDGWQATGNDGAGDSGGCGAGDILLESARSYSAVLYLGYRS